MTAETDETKKLELYDEYWGQKFIDDRPADQYADKTLKEKESIAHTMLQPICRNLGKTAEEITMSKPGANKDKEAAATKP